MYRNNYNSQPFLHYNHNYKPQFASNPQYDNKIYLLQSQHYIEKQHLNYQFQKILDQNKQLNSKLNHQKQQIFNLKEIIRRLEQQIQRMQFQSNKNQLYQNTGLRQIKIKLECLDRDNQNYRKQLDFISQELKIARKDNLILILENSSLKKDIEIINKSYQELLNKRQTNDRFKEIDNQNIKQQASLICRLKTPLNMSNQYLPKSQINHIETTADIKPHKNRTQQCLNRQFYENQQSKQYCQQTLMLKTYQKAQLKCQLNYLRKQLVNQLLNKYYHKSLEIAKKKHSNCLRQFILLIQKNIQVLFKMACNYLQAKQTVDKQCCNQIKKFNNDWIYQIYIRVKNDLKKNRNQSQYLGLFRLLTIHTKLPNNHELQQSIEHSTIKIIYKLHQLLTD